MGLALLVLAAGTAPATAAPQVVINGQPLVSSLTPLTISGTMLLPMRDVFEALQAEVKWFASERRIMAVRGDTTISLILGSRTALVNNTPVQLPVPPQLVGASTYVPLRFPAEAFGGTVRWDNATQTAFIDIPTGPGEVSGTITTPPTDTTPPTPPTPPAPVPTAVRGTVVEIYKTANPAVLIQQADTEALRLLQLKPNVAITRGPDGQAAAAATLDDIQAGDFALATLEESGQTSQLALTYGQRAGKVAAVAGNTLLFDDGSTMALGGTVRVLGPSNETATLAQVTPGTQVEVRYHPQTRTVWQITLPTPAAPPPATPPAGEKVEIFALGVVNPAKVFKAGDEVTVQLQGTPGGQATATVSGQVVKGLALAEVQPGIYQGTFTVPDGLTAPASTLTGNLTKAGRKARVLVSPDRLTFDSQAPVVVALAPEDRATVPNDSPGIQVSFDDGEGSGVDLNTVKLVLDNRDVTAQTNIDVGSVFYAAQGLRLGLHRAQVSFKDLAGNQCAVSWTFTVGTPVQTLISSVNHDAQGVMQQGQLVTVSARVAEPGGTATFNIGTWKQGLPMQRDGNTAYYRGSYRIQPGDKLANAPITVQYRNPRGQQATMLATAKLSFDGTLPTALRIVSPANNSTAGDQIQVSGVAPPGSSVRVTMAYRAKLLVWTTGQLWQGTVRATTKGIWQTAAVDSNIFLGKASEYNITAELLDNTGNVVSTQTVKLIR